VHQYFIIFYRSSAKRSKEHVARRGKPTYCTVELYGTSSAVWAHTTWWTGDSTDFLSFDI